MRLIGDRLVFWATDLSKFLACQHLTAQTRAVEYGAARPRTVEDPAVEVLRGTPTVRRLVGEGKMAELHDVMKRGEHTGMTTLNQSLVGLCTSGAVDPAVAMRQSANPHEFSLNMQGMFTGIDSIDVRTRDAQRKDDRENS